MCIVRSIKVHVEWIERFPSKYDANVFEACKKRLMREIIARSEPHENDSKWEANYGDFVGLEKLEKI